MWIVLFLALVGNIVWFSSAFTWRRRAKQWERVAVAWEGHAHRAVKDRNEWVYILLGKLEAYGNWSAGELRRTLREQTTPTPPTKPVN